MRQEIGPAGSFVELLQTHASRQADRRCFTFLLDGEEAEDHLSYGELDQRARAIAARLQQEQVAGQRVLLLFPSGLEYICAFFGCLYAAAVPVPVYPPRPNRSLERIRAIVSDAQPRMALALQSQLADLERWAAQDTAFAGVRWIASDAIAAQTSTTWRSPRFEPQGLAFLQYTSGSTGNPRGVMVSHANLMANEKRIQEAFEHTERSRVAGWLPLYHDMGLIGNVLQTVYLGVDCVLMSPVAFLKKPVRWLQAISRFRVTTSGAPNFAYELCLQEVNARQREQLDLSCWQVAYNGAEPIQAETLERFADVFAPSGFHRAAFHPCYGLAEGTLMVTGGKNQHSPVIRCFDATALERNEVQQLAEPRQHGRRLVGCGRSLSGQTVRIVDPETQEPCPPDRIGEIWVSGPSVAVGYWNNPKETNATFRGQLGDGKEPYLRTGDLGFFCDGQLFVAGRCKDLIIIRGANHYPQDIELSVARSHAALEGCSGAAFHWEVEGAEHVVVVQEIKRTWVRQLPLDEVVEAVCQNLFDQHEIQLYGLVLVKPGGVPRTSSGKVQRHACREAYAAGTLPVVGQWSRPPRPGGTAAETEQPGPSRDRPTPESLQDWLTTRLAQRLGVAPQTIDVKQPFARYGIDSLTAVRLAGELEDYLGRPLSVTLAYDYPTIEKLVRHLCGDEERGLKLAPIGDERAEYGGMREPIAVVGMACRFPDAAGPEAFWQLLRDGRETVGPLPSIRRHDGRSWTDGTIREPGVDRGGFLDRVDLFDPGFFGVSGREAQAMDPQQRLLLEVAWEALEDAALAPDRCAGSRMGVFVGISNVDYGPLALDGLDTNSIYASTGNAVSIAANRISYALDLRGPSWAVDTACSSSLVAVHQAVASLRQRECDGALAGGVNVILSACLSSIFAQTGFLAPDGRCKTFANTADGYVRGEGCGLVVLKRLSDALRDQDRILAVVLGSAVNQDGRSNGLTAPNRLSQQAVLRAALRDAGVAAAEIGYVEAHGTGTPLGDPIEMAALGAVFGPDRPRGQPLLVGSVKTNIGHLEAAAGIAGLIKVILALQHRQIPPHLHFHQPSAHIPWDELPVVIPTDATPWASPDGRRLAGVSSFGFGGTNAHVILAEPPEASGPEAVDGCERSCHVLALSACDPEALQQLAGRYAEHAAARTDWPLADAAFTANCGRQHFSHRLAFVAGSAGEACEKLQQFARGQVPPGGFRAVAEPASPPIAFLFSGQGAQYAEMARELDRSQPRFRQTLDECDALLSAWLERPLREVLYGATGGEALLQRTAFTQPALFAIEYALAGLWREWGVEPRYLLGHSIGEYVAACLAGVFDLPGALKLVAARGRLMDRLPAGGAMAAVGADRSTVQAALGARDSGCVVVAADNGPRQVVISGPSSAVQAVVARLSGAGVRSRMLPVSHAFHSPLVEPMLEQYASVVGQVPLSAPRRHMISNVTGRLAGEELATVDYWCRQIRQPVEFAAGMRTLASLGCRAFLEVGPGTALVNLGRQCLEADADLLWAASLRPERADGEVLGESLSALYVRGVPVDWRAWDGAYARRKVSLPSYPFQRQRYWVEGTGGVKASTISGYSGSAHPLLGRRLSTAGQEVLFEGRLSAREPAYLGDHRVGGAVLFPASGFAELALAAGATVDPDAPLCVEDMTLEQALPLSDASPAILQTVLTPLPDDHWRFQLFRLTDQSSGAAPRWVRHAVARLAPRQQTPESGVTDRVDFESFGVDRFRPDDIYQRLALAGLHYGENFRILRAIRRGRAAVMAEICLPDSLSDSLTDYRLHPVLLDGAFQLLAVLTDGVAGSDASFLPVGMRRIEWYRPPGRRLYAQLRIASGELSEESLVDLRFDVELFSLQHERIARVEGLRLERVDRLRLTRAISEDTSDWLYEVVWRRRAGRAAPRGEAADRDGTWLLLADSTGVADRLAADLVRRGQRCVLFRARGEYARVSEEEYYVRPSLAEDFQTAVAEVCGQDAPACRGVVHLWSLDSPFAADPGLDALSETQRLACASALHLVQALVGQKPVPRLWLVTRGAQAVDSQSGVRDVAQATLWGFGRVLPLEHPDLRTVLVDLDAESSSAAAADEILTEILEPDDEQQVAYRQAERWVARLVHYRPPARGGAPSVRGDATYLITGGLGALGQHVARWLASRGARHLVLAGRRAVGSAAAREQAEALAAAGVDVRMLDVDVSVAADVDRLMDEITGCMPPLRGIVHAAGILDDGIILQQNWQRVGRVLAPKVQGAWNLHERTKDLSLDFFVAFSSMASLLGSPGQVGYAAANAFLDVLAHYRLQLGLAGLTVNWGPWDETGMAATRGEHDQARRIAAGIGLLSPHQGLNLLLRLLDQPVPDVGVMPVDWPRFFRQRPGDSLLGELDQTAGDRDWQEPAILSRWEGASPSERQTLVENYLRTEIGRVLRLKPDDVQMQRSLVGMGLDSLMAMELRNRVLKDLGVEIPLAAFIDELPVTGFAVMMVDQLVHKLSDSPPCPSTAGSAGNGDVEWLEGEL